MDLLATLNTGRGRLFHGTVTELRKTVVRVTLNGVPQIGADARLYLQRAPSSMTAIGSIAAQCVVCSIVKLRDGCQAGLRIKWWDDDSVDLYCTPETTE